MKTLMRNGGRLAWGARVKFMELKTRITKTLHDRFVYGMKHSLRLSCQVFVEWRQENGLSLLSPCIEMALSI